MLFRLGFPHVEKYELYSPPSSVLINRITYQLFHYFTPDWCQANQHRETQLIPSPFWNYWHKISLCPVFWGTSSIWELLGISTSGLVIPTARSFIALDCNFSGGTDINIFLPLKGYSTVSLLTNGKYFVSSFKKRIYIICFRLQNRNIYPTHLPFPITDIFLIPT